MAESKSQRMMGEQVVESLKHLMGRFDGISGEIRETNANFERRIRDSESNVEGRVQEMKTSLEE